MNKKITGQRVIRTFEEWVPKDLALKDDPIGLNVGTLNKQVKNVMITLDVLENVVDEAIERDVDLIIAHHPFIFRPLKEINLDSEKGRIVAKLIKHDIAVYAAHTNLDAAEGGVNDALCDAIGVGNRKVLIETDREKLFKLVVFVPQTHQDQVREAISMAGAGHIGNYSHCTFQTEGKGNFMPLEGTEPFIGSKGELETVQEVRMETIVPNSRLSKVLTAMEEAHPYEEVAYDLYPLANKGQKLGFGRIGTLNKEMTLKQFADHLKVALDVPTVRVVGNLDDKIKRVAILGGDGNKFISTAKRQNADVFVTGDLYFHVAHDALGMGLNVIDPGHHVEKVMKKAVKDYLDKQFAGEDINFFISEAKTEPFTFI